MGFTINPWQKPEIYVTGTDDFTCLMMQNPKIYYNWNRNLVIKVCDLPASDFECWLDRLSGNSSRISSATEPGVLGLDSPSFCLSWPSRKSTNFTFALWLRIMQIGYFLLQSLLQINVQKTYLKSCRTLVRVWIHYLSTFQYFQNITTHTIAP